MKFAYADPPYLGMCKAYKHDHGSGNRPFDGRCWDEPETHRLLIEHLNATYDGWALSLHVPSLGVILALCPEDVIVMAWCKSWASWKPGVYPARAWEPVILRGPRKRRYAGGSTTPSDWFVTHAAQFGFFGAKPEPFTWWILDCLGVRQEDDFTDIFTGSGLVDKAYQKWRAQATLGLDTSVREIAEQAGIDLRHRDKAQAQIDWLTRKPMGNE